MSAPCNFLCPRGVIQILQITGFAILLLSALPGTVAAAGEDKLTIVTETGRHEFVVEIAATPSDRTRGLMFRKSMATDAGMLFDYVRPQPVAMWMKNTYIPLDMLFVREDGQIANVAQRTVPHSLTPIPSAGPVRAVVELNAGTVARLKIRPGDRLEHPIFKGRD